MDVRVSGRGAVIKVLTHTHPVFRFMSYEELVQLMGIIS